jgi:hypothetical protein
MKVKMSVAGDSLAYDVHQQLSFDVENTFAELGAQPGQLAWWYSLLTLKQEEIEYFKTRMDAAFAERELELRADTDDLTKRYGKITEAIFKAELAVDVDLQSLQNEYTKLKREEGLLKAMTRGMESRSVLLATASSAQKSEVQARLRALVRKTEKGE